MAEFENTASEALEAGDSATLLAAAAMWEQQAASFWEENVIDSPAPPAKQEELKSKKWLTCTDWAMQVVSDKGWSRFHIKPGSELENDPENLPTMCFCIDQGSDGWSAAM